MSSPKLNDLRVWHIPQIPMKPFYVDVDSIVEGVKTIDILAHYDLFQYENDIKPDYSNVSGLQRYEEDGSGFDWFDIDEMDLDDEIGKEVGSFSE